MSRDWKPGDVAWLTGTNGVEGVVMRYDNGKCFRWQDKNGDLSPDGNWIGDLRPLVVIDPDDHEQVADLSRRIAAAECGDGMAPRDAVQAALRSLVAPEKPAEPTGLGAVVEDAEGTPWVRCENVDLEPHWYARNKARPWHEIAAIKVLSEGVTA